MPSPGTSDSTVWNHAGRRCRLLRYTRNRAYLTEVYRNALAREVRALGYEIDSDRDAKGRDCGFEIQGMPAELIERFSERSRQRDRAIAVFTEENGRRPTNNEIAVLVRESRAPKLAEISTGEVRQRQLAKLARSERLALAGILRGSAQQELISDQSKPALDHAGDHIFERVSVAPISELLTEALRSGRGKVQLSALKGEVALKQSAGTILRRDNEIATAESLQRERRTVQAINEGVGIFEMLGGSHDFVGSDRLRPEQKRAIDFVLRSRDFAMNISGAAGPGKQRRSRNCGEGLRKQAATLLL